MKRYTFRLDRWKIGLAIFWIVFTFSMVTWWWVFALSQLDILGANLPPEKFNSFRRMLLSEGSILLLLIVVGGSALVMFTVRERSRNLRLRLFFSNFSHDLKTSINRLRLRAEVVIANSPNADLQKLMEEVNRLDLQLENSLWVSKGEEQKLFTQKVSLHQMISSLRAEWPDIEISLHGNAVVLGDQQAVQSIFRNLLQNAQSHGNATRIEIRAQKISDEVLAIYFQDNGTGYSGDAKALGEGFIPQTGRQSNGIGLYLAKSLLARMQSKIEFLNLASGFQVRLEIPGRLEGSK